MAWTMWRRRVMTLCVGLCLLGSIPGSPRSALSQIIPGMKLKAELPVSEPELPLGGSLLSQNIQFPAGENELPSKLPPGRRQPAQLRCCPCGCSQKPLTALIPQTNLGLTVAEYPTFFFYVPPNTAQQAELILLDENDNEVYQKTLDIAGRSGIITVSLAEGGNLPKLEIGKYYHWNFDIICHPDDRSGDLFVDGWILRVSPTSTLMGDLQKASLRDRVAIYGAAGFWYDTLTTLAGLIQSQPQDATLAAKWAELLNSVGLEAIAPEPLERSDGNKQPVSKVGGGC